MRAVQRLLRLTAQGAACGAAVVILGFAFGAYFAYARHGLHALHRMIEVRPGDLDLYEKLVPIGFAYGFAVVPFYHACKWLDARVRAWRQAQNRARQ
jgi:hypothetical protein